MVTACLVAALDAILIAALPPLLPYYDHRFGLGGGAAGLLTASYSIGLLAAAIPAGILVTRLGQRRVVILALGVLALSSVLFGVAGSVTGLVAARAVEGVASAFSWTAMFAWLTAASPPGVRARMFGTVFTAAFFGFTLGPALGAVAVALGPALAFGTFGAIAGLVAIGTALLPAPHARPPERPIRAYLRLAARPGVPYALWLQALPGMLAAVTGLIAALKLGQLGASTTVIAAAFVVGSIIQGITSTVAGAWTDRAGTHAPIRFSLLGSALLTLLVAPSSRPSVLAIVVALSLGVFAIVLPPATSLLTSAVEGAGEDPTLGFALMNLAFAPGAILGFLGAGIALEAFGELTPLLAISALCVLTAVTPRRFRRPCPPLAISASHRREDVTL